MFAEGAHSTAGEDEWGNNERKLPCEEITCEHPGEHLKGCGRRQVGKDLWLSAFVHAIS